MALKNAYLKGVYAALEKKSAHEPEFLQAVQEVLESLEPVVERRPDGVVVNGAKCHLTGITNAHEVVVLPTQAMRPGQEDYAIAFHIPLDTPGITMIVGRQSCDTRKLEEGADIDLGNAAYGGIEALTIFDHVFVPNENIFLNGEVDFAGMLVELFAAGHRNSYGGFNSRGTGSACSAKRLCTNTTE